MSEMSEEGPKEVAAELHELVTGMVRLLVLDRQGMSLTTTAVLDRLEREGPIRLTVLAAAEGVTQPSMTALVQRLEAQDLASRVADPEDGRVRLVTVTDAGRERLAQRRRAGDARVADLLATLPEQDVRALAETMHTVMPIVRRMLGTAPRLGAKGDGSASRPSGPHPSASRSAGGTCPAAPTREPGPALPPYRMDRVSGEGGEV
ncbi:MarR family winged helix-turn-helix transcriptional regulator [Streptomyces sp. NPDC000609]|uniref:MarR family winged helix-turn-helix transcriptional regulator n=1 Tax=Streptomyces sp. NPDC000609 TaxID=3160957 RepID=UPI0033965EAB